jgi:hypothetical protein
MPGPCRPQATFRKRRGNSGVRLAVAPLPKRIPGTPGAPAAPTPAETLLEQLVEVGVVLSIAKIGGVTEDVPIAVGVAEWDHASHPVGWIGPKHRPRSHRLHQVFEIPVQHEFRDDGVEQVGVHGVFEGQGEAVGRGRANFSDARIGCCREQQRANALRAEKMFGCTLFCAAARMTRGKDGAAVVTVRVQNRGAVRMYYAWPAEVEALGANGKATGQARVDWPLPLLFPGQKAEWSAGPSTPPDGVRAVLLRIANPMRSGHPVAFANAEIGTVRDGWLMLSLALQDNLCLGDCRGGPFLIDIRHVLHTNPHSSCLSAGPTRDSGTYGNGPTPGPGFGQPLAGITNQLPARELQFSAS